MLGYIRRRWQPPVETDANGNLTRNTYDALNQLVEQALPADRLRTFAYDRVGNKVAETDANGHLTTFAYDARNRLTTRTDPLGHTITRTYDAMGNRLTETDPRGHTTTSYDARNRLTQPPTPSVRARN
jgi:YD repeat-containing protein